MTKSTPAAAEELREFPTQQPKAMTGSTRRGTEGGWSGAQPAQSRTDRGTALHQGQGDTATPTTAIHLVHFHFQNGIRNKTRIFFRKNSTI